MINGLISLTLRGFKIITLLLSLLVNFGIALFSFAFIIDFLDYEGRGFYRIAATSTSLYIAIALFLLKEAFGLGHIAKRLKMGRSKNPEALND